jgi:hypothetical protein
MVELPRIRAATNLHPNYTVLFANTLTAFALNLVSGLGAG